MLISIILKQQARFQTTERKEGKSISLQFLRNFFFSDSKSVSHSSGQPKKLSPTIKTKVSGPYDAPYTQDGYNSGNIYHSTIEPANNFELHSTRSVNGHSYVAGFMDFDPKFAARSAHRMSSNRGSLKRGESSWFNK